MRRLTELGPGLNFPLTYQPGRLPRFFAMTDDKRGLDPLRLIAHIPDHCGLVFRHYDHPNREDLARQVVRRCKSSRVFCLLAGDIRLALKLGADGVHLPEYKLRQSRCQIATLRQQGGKVTSSVHSLRAAYAADHFGVDGLFISPVFSTKSHPGTASLGLSRFATISRCLQSPVFGLGGISSATSKRVFLAGAYGIAGISLFSNLEVNEDSRNTGHYHIKDRA